MEPTNRSKIAVGNLKSAAGAIKTNNNFRFQGIPVKNTFPVLGMSCASCAASAQSMIKASEGVADASVNYATGNLTVEYFPNQTNPQKLQKQLQSIGYDLLIEEESKQQDTLENLHQEKFNKLKRKTILAAILSVPVVIIGMFFNGCLFYQLP